MVFQGGGANCLTIVSIIHLDIYIVQYISIIQYKCQVIIFIVLWIYSFAVGGSFSSSAGGLPGTWGTRMFFHYILYYNKSIKFLNPVDSRILTLSSLFGDRFAFIWWVISVFIYFLKSSRFGCTLKHLLFHMNFLISINR